jgi:hypothetical protein
MILLEVLISTGRKQGQIMIEYKCRVLLSSAKLSNLKVIRIFEAIGGKEKRADCLNLGKRL